MIATSIKNILNPVIAVGRNLSISGELKPGLFWAFFIF